MSTSDITLTLCVRCWTRPVFYANGLCQPCDEKRQVEERRELTSMNTLLERVGKLEAAHTNRLQTYSDLLTCLNALQQNMVTPDQYQTRNYTNARGALEIAIPLLSYLLRLEHGLETKDRAQTLATQMFPPMPVETKEYQIGQIVYYPVDRYNYTRQENMPDPFRRGLITEKDEFLPGMFKYTLRDRETGLEVIRYGTEIYETYPAQFDES